jgi:hypothetical protein
LSRLVCPSLTQVETKSPRNSRTLNKKTSMASLLEDLTDARKLIHLYINGSNGDVDKLEAAFHTYARMFGRLDDNPTTSGPISDFIEWIGQTPGNAGPNYRVDIRQIDISGDAGVAILVETDYLGHDFVDYFSVVRIDGVWKITNKTYADMGAAQPAAWSVPARTQQTPIYDSPNRNSHVM